MIWLWEKRKIKNTRRGGELERAGKEKKEEEEDEVERHYIHGIITPRAVESESCACLPQTPSCLCRLCSLPSAQCFCLNPSNR